MTTEHTPEPRCPMCGQRAASLKVLPAERACAGIPDPETTIPELIDALRGAFQVAERWAPKRKDSLAFWASERVEKARAVLAKIEGGQQG